MSHYALLLNSVAYWHSARIIYDNTGKPTILQAPLAHLLALSAELSLKHFLLTAGLSKDSLASRNFGHKLDRILVESIKRGLILSPTEVRAILWMKYTHSVHYFRYGANFDDSSYSYQFPDEMVALVVCASLIDKVSGNPLVLRRGYGPKNSDINWPGALSVRLPVTVDLFREIAASIERERTALAKNGRRMVG